MQARDLDQFGIQENDLVPIHIGCGQQVGFQNTQTVAAGELGQGLAVDLAGAVRVQKLQFRQLPPQHDNPVGQHGKVADTGEGRVRAHRKMLHLIALRAQCDMGAWARGAHSSEASTSAMPSIMASLPRGPVSISPAPGRSASGRLTEQPSMTLARLVLRRASRFSRS